MKIVITEDAAFVENEGHQIADICFIGGLATCLFGSDEGISAKQADLAARQDAELREQAVAALANDYCPPHLEEGKRAMQKAVRTNRNTAGQVCAQHYAERWEWARQVAPGLPVERRA